MKYMEGNFGVFSLGTSITLLEPHYLNIIKSHGQLND